MRPHANGESMRTFARFLLLALLFQSLLAGCVPRKPHALAPEYIDAQELKLKIRELADQMLSTTPNSGLSDLVAMPTSFVDLDNKRQSSPLGKLFAESLIYEFNQRAFPVCEYRLTGNIDVTLGQGDFALLRQGLVSTVGKKWAALIVGTYYRDRDAVFVNARLVRAHDGMVLRTGQLVLVKNALVDRLTASVEPLPYAAPPPPPPPPSGLVSRGSLSINPAPWQGTPAKKRGTSGSPGLQGTPTP